MHPQSKRRQVAVFTDTHCAPQSPAEANCKSAHYLRNCGFATEVEALMTDLRGKAAISARQRQVVELAAEGLTDKEIGERLALSGSTLRTYWDRLRLRTEAKSRTAVIARLSANRLDSLSREHDQLIQLVQTLPMLVWTTEPTGHVSFCNDWFFHIGGLRPEDCIGRGCRALMLDEDLPAEAQRWQHALETEQPYEVPVRFRCADSRLRWHQVRLYPLRTSSGSVYKWVGTAAEILAELPVV